MFTYYLSLCIYAYFKLTESWEFPKSTQKVITQYNLYLEFIFIKKTGIFGENDSLPWMTISQKWFNCLISTFSRRAFRKLLKRCSSDNWWHVGVEEAASQSTYKKSSPVWSTTYVESTLYKNFKKCIYLFTWCSFANGKLIF